MTRLVPEERTSRAGRYRPADLCRGLRGALEASEGRRRRRARDTRPDAIGLRLRRELLEAAIRDDPEPQEFEGWLLQYCTEAGSGNGGIRAMAISIFEEWRLAEVDPTFRAWLEEGAPSEDKEVRSSRRQISSLLLALWLPLASGACKPERYGEPPAGEPSTEVVEPPAPGGAVAMLREGADPSLTIYLPPPDLAQKDDGVVFIPSTSGD